MYHPFQCLARVALGDEKYLLSACGSQLLVSSLDVASKPGPICRWSVKICENNTQDDGPAKKRRRLDEDVSTTEITKLVPAPDQRHVVIVTSVDKCIRVLSIENGGQLAELSQRCMPKRPCAVSITDDSRTIICADKFGDVYSLPLHPSKEQYTPAPVATATQRRFAPSASETTVHTKGNRRVLAEQLRNLDNGVDKPKETLLFEHQLLLGHVSMLTDLQLASSIVNGTLRSFIITCDRDEHIRVSRGMPQAHVTEMFCLGHKQFLSRIRVISGRDLLVSGGGDDWLGVWDWRKGQLLAKHDLRSALLGDGKIAVAHIWLISSFIVVKIESSTQLVLLQADKLLDTDAAPHVIDCSGLGGQIHDMVELDERQWLVSLDAEQRLRIVKPVQSTDGTWQLSSVQDRADQLEALNAVDVARPSAERLEDLLYGVERMRKQELGDDF